MRGCRSGQILWEAGPLLVTPGIRADNSDVADQKRVATVRAAVEAGSNFLVVGRPILQAPDPSKAANEILAQIDNVFDAV